MNDTEKLKDWLRYFEICPNLGTLKAIERNDGTKMLERALRELGLVSSLDVVRRCRE